MSGTVSIIMPTYNRARFLRQAFASIVGQAYHDWELIVVDDGSTDESPALIDELSADLPARVLRQQNRGAYAARNAGLDAAQGDYIAFYDTDDYWYPHHLTDCVGALAEHPDIDWSYGACRVVRYETDEVLEPSSFYVRGEPRPFMRLRGRAAGRLRILDDPNACACMLEHGLFCGLQNSVLRRSMFAEKRFQPSYPDAAADSDVVEDQVLVVEAVKAGKRLAYYDAIHVDYRIHPWNTCGAQENQSVQRKLHLYEASMRRYEGLLRDMDFTRAERQALKRRLSRDLFWIMGYSLLWKNGQKREALACYRRGLRLWPWSPWYWKTYVLAWLRSF